MAEEKYCFEIGEEGHTEKEWENRCNEIEKLGNDPSQLIAFYQSCQVSGTKKCDG